MEPFGEIQVSRSDIVPFCFTRDITRYKEEMAMSDQHQVSSIIAGCISDTRKDHPDGRIDPEEAKQMAKCIVEALSSAGLQIVPISKD